MTSPKLTLEGISKSFPGVRALHDVNLELYSGEVTALIGENGAGKSTLVKILTGIYQPDEGEIRIDGEAVTVPTPHAGFEMGISAIHQETVLFDELSVAENIYLGHAPQSRFGTIDWKRMRAKADNLLGGMGVDHIRPEQRLRELSIANRHLVAIARALSIEAEIVIMDEPTAALSHKEIEDLFVLIEKLKKDGRAVLFISHKFEEVYSIADRFTVFRDGEMVGKGHLGETNQRDIVRLMVGRSIDQIFPKREVEIGEPVLKVEGLGHPTEFADISFELRRGEILGFYGLVGSGRSELMQALFGITRPSSGEVALEGETIEVKSPADAIDAGIVYVPEERGRQGVVVERPIFENVSLPSLRRTSRNGFLKLAEEYRLTRVYTSRLDLRASSLSQDVGTLSGGNQQKIVVAKWLATRPRVIILDEPTKGIDIGSKAAVHEFMGDLVADGLSVIMVSSELPEIMGMSDRIVVMREGRIAAMRINDGTLTAETLVGDAAGYAEQVA
jgi:rhamnose transport system ATP-binding protein